MISALRWILLPISLIYWLIVWSRNKLYDKGILKSTKFTIPTIVIGNLAIGGTGKSPTTEYVIRLLKDHYKIASLSRGYGRKTKGFRFVKKDSLAIEVGDEPLQFKTKFPDITIAVSEDRCLGIRKLQKDHDVIILDDAYQHRRLHPGYTILLFDFKSLFSPIITLPTGDFRDNFSATKRADLILITKCPNSMTTGQKKHIEHRIRKYSLAPIFYTGIEYDRPVTRSGEFLEQELTAYEIVLFCGIANPSPLRSHLIAQGNLVHMLTFPDHYNYTDKDFHRIENYFRSISPKTNKIILTTEKDIQRIPDSALRELPLFYIPIHLKSMDHQQQTFDRFILHYLNSQPNVN